MTSRWVGCAGLVLAVVPRVAFAQVTWSPGQGELGTVLVEDLWPCAGDADFNDAVLRYNVRRVESAGQAISLTMAVDVHALGASKCSGLGLRVTGLDAATVTAADRIVGTAGTSDGVPWSAATPVEVGTDASGTTVLWLSPDLRADLCPDATGPFVNTDPDAPVVGCRPMAIHVTLDGTGTVSPTEPWDLFTFECGDRSHQIHRPEFYGLTGTDAADGTQFGHCADTSQAAPPVGTRWYTLSQPTPGIAAVLIIPEGLSGSGGPLNVFPQERVRIDDAMPRIVGWVAGTPGYDDWYSVGTVGAHLFTTGAGAPLPALAVGTFPATEPEACVLAGATWTAGACACAFPTSWAWNGTTGSCAPPPTTTCGGFTSMYLCSGTLVTETSSTSGYSQGTCQARCGSYGATCCIWDSRNGNCWGTLNGAMTYTGADVHYATTCSP